MSELKIEYGDTVKGKLSSHYWDTDELESAIRTEFDGVEGIKIRIIDANRDEVVFLKNQ